jgi:hypothetical protein
MGRYSLGFQDKERRILLLTTAGRFTPPEIADLEEKLVATIAKLGRPLTLVHDQQGLAGMDDVARDRLDALREKLLAGPVGRIGVVLGTTGESVMRLLHVNRAFREAGVDGKVRAFKTTPEAVEFLAG